jgi:hypothetical protein
MYIRRIQSDSSIIIGLYGQILFHRGQSYAALEGTDNAHKAIADFEKAVDI